METKKLTCCDLMVGDYFRYKDGTIVRIARVGDVSPMDAPIYCHTLLEGYFPCQFEDIEPIPLTAEILEKNGFEWRAYGVVLAGEDMALVQCSDYWKIKPNQDSNDTFCYIWYVHELQHALRLCGVDKEIVL